MNKIAALLLILLAASCRKAPAVISSPSTAATAKETVPMEWKGQSSSAAKPWTVIVKTQAQWEKVWETIGQEPPPVDFTAHFAVAVFLGQKNSGGYGINFLDPTHDSAAQTLTIRYEMTSPKGMAIQVLTQPYAVRLFPKTDLAVNVETASP